MATRIRMTTNLYGVKIKRCCASCQYKEIDKEGRRRCVRKKKRKRVMALDKCSYWIMEKHLAELRLNIEY